jgi:GDPmannose 4,6-dehydratase
MNNNKLAIISGITGQDGRLLADHLLAIGYRVIGLSRTKLSHLLSKNNQKVDILTSDYSYNSLSAILEHHLPNEFYNLTGQTFVGKSWSIIEETIDASALIPLNIVRAITEKSPKTKLFQASSSEVYAQSPNALTEKSAQGPINPYGCAKSFSHNIISSYRNNYNIFAVNGILFNHESPYRNSNFLSQKVVEGALKIHAGQASELYLGNLDIERDWGHAYDYVRAMHLMLQADTPKDYNICTGKKQSVRSLVHFVFDYLNLDYKNHVKVNKDFVRSNEIKVIYGDNSKIKKELNWKLSFSFEEMLIDMIEFKKGNINNV